MLIMSNLKMHRTLSKIILGESGNEVHKFMDAPAKQLGRNHRDVRHDLRTVAILSVVKGRKAGRHALGHIILDKSISPAKTTAENLIKKGILPVLKEIKQIRGLK